MVAILDLVMHVHLTAKTDGKVSLAQCNCRDLANRQISFFIFAVPGVFM